MELARLAQVNVQINESRRDDESPRVECFIGALQVRADFGDAALAQQHVGDGIHVRCRINDAAVFNEQAHALLENIPRVWLPRRARD